MYYKVININYYKKQKNTILILFPLLFDILLDKILLNYCEDINWKIKEQKKNFLIFKVPEF